jgi:hypothetical protein
VRIEGQSADDPWKLETNGRFGCRCCNQMNDDRGDRHRRRRAGHPAGRPARSCCCRPAWWRRPQRLHGPPLAELFGPLPRRPGSPPMPLGALPGAAAAAVTPSSLWWCWPVVIRSGSASAASCCSGYPAGAAALPSGPQLPAAGLRPHRGRPWQDASLDQPARPRARSPGGAPAAAPLPWRCSPIRARAAPRRCGAC